MRDRIRLGVLTPSSNTVMEPLVAEILAGTPEITAHFSRFRVTEISMGQAALNQFDTAPQLAAAELLTDARVDAITWGGTSGGWVGIGGDRALCARLAAMSERPASTTTLATLAAFQALGVKDYGLVTPYLDSVQTAIIANYEAEGFTCLAERHLGDRGNFSFAEYNEPQIEAMIRDVAAQGAKVIAVYCTNFLGTRLAARLEDTLNITLVDSIAVTVWHALALAGGDPARISGWGRLFSVPAAQEAQPA